MQLISVIIPVSPKETRLGRCLRNLSLQDYRNFEVITVIDGPSQNEYSNLVSDLDYKIIKLDKNSGPGFARNRGVQNSKGDILFFIDSDVLLPKNALSLILESYSKYPDIAGVAGLYSESNSFGDFASVYKNLQSIFEESDKPEFITYCRSAVFSIKRRFFDLIGGYNEKLGKMPCEDRELCLRLGKKGLKFHLNRNLRVIHEKGFTLPQLLRQDFERVRSRCIIDLNYKGENSVNYLLKLDEPFRYYLKCIILTVAPLLSLFLLLLGLLSRWFLIGAFFSFLIFLLAEVSFLKYLKKVKNTVFMLKGLIMSFVQMLIAGCAIGITMLRALIFKNVRI